MLKKMIFTIVIISSQLMMAGTTVAIIDSGVDYKHDLYKATMWTNPIDKPGNNRDEDGNGYEDDFIGWNFAEDNDEIIDYSYLGIFSDDPYKFFELQGESFVIQKRKADGTSTPADDKRMEEIRAWMLEKRESAEFMKEMQIFGNFVHGTHVAGIASKADPNLKIMGVKLLPTEVKLPVSLPKMGKGSKSKKPWKVNDSLMRAILKSVANAQTESMKNIAVYLDGHGVSVANGSFGTGYHQAKMIVTMLTKLLTLGRGTYEGDIDKMSKFFIQAAAEAGKEFVKLSPNTLYVFAAGNDGLNNDEFGTSPANINADNVITVAATFNNNGLAPFSNYGQKVHVAAPGVIISSSIPGNEYMKVSGTSQAAPYVANLAGMIRDTNPQLTPKQVKEILMRTVTKASFLDGKVLTAGFVNEEKAIKAAQLSTTMELEIAINEVEDKNILHIPGVEFPQSLDGSDMMFSAIPLTPVFKFPKI